MAHVIKQPKLCYLTFPYYHSSTLTLSFHSHWPALLKVKAYLQGLFKQAFCLTDRACQANFLQRKCEDASADTFKTIATKTERIPGQAKNGLPRNGGGQKRERVGIFEWTPFKLFNFNSFYSNETQIFTSPLY